MPTTTTILVPMQDLQPDTLILANTTVPTGATTASIQFSLANVITLTLVVTFTWEISLDGGVTFTSAGGGSLDLSRSGYELIPGGGVMVPPSVQHPDGVPVPFASVGLNFPQPTTDQTVLQGSVEWTEAVTSELSLVVS
jgi:hypothetical protein